MSGPPNIPPEDQPSWLDDLLSEPETPPNKGHRRSSSDSLATFDSVRLEDDLLVRNFIKGKPQRIELPLFFQGQVRLNRNCGSTFSTASPLLPDVPVPRKKEAESKKLTRCYSLIEPDRKMFGGSEAKNEGDDVLYTALESSSGGSECSQTRRSAVPSAAKTEVKRKQNNARRSRMRKLQYIAELERSVQALQLQGVEASAQIEFLDQQNQLLGMENRALKQYLESLSQQHLIKSLEQERLARLQYMHHMQQQQTMHPALHRRSKSHGLDSQLAILSINPQEMFPNYNGF